MKVSEAIRELKIGDEVWLKGKVNDKVMPMEESGCSTIYPIHVSGFGYIGKDTEIVLAEPQVEKVEVPQFVADWFEKNKDMLDYSIWKACIDSEADYDDLEETTGNEFYDWFLNVDGRNKPKGITTLIRMQDGYTVNPKRWVVKSAGDYLKDLKLDAVQEIAHRYAVSTEIAIKFTDRAKAEAVATLVEGTVEEV